MAKKKFYAVFAETTATRESEHDYPYATCKRDPSGIGWKIVFHKDWDSAARRAGKHGTIAYTERIK
jgi:hypothetical protein